MKKLLLLASFLLPLAASSLNISVRIYSANTIKAVIIAPKTGKYLLLGDGKFIDTISSENVYQIKTTDSSIEIKTLEHELGKFSSVQLRPCIPDCSFDIKPISEKIKRLYNDGLTLSNTGGYLKMINIVELEHYIAGVVECEAGYRQAIEFYKAQAIICRTYALNNLARHLGEYYELCDAVHCQVYRGTATVPEITVAVEQTMGLVISDSAKRLINAAYYSNCGGYTMNSEDVWSTYVPYLRSVRDTFCLKQPHARWEKHVSLQDWTSYFTRKESTQSKADTTSESYWDSIPEQKRVYLYDKGYIISLKDMRLDLNLHSTYFKIEKTGDEVILKGRGNGHRVGFCQEGAMRMAQLGYTYTQILTFYYQGIQVLLYSSLPMEAGTN